MKKTILIILSIFLAMIVCIYMNYRENLITKMQVQKFNSEFEFYNKESILGTDVTTIINKAIDNNEKLGIKKDENGMYIANDENSIKIYIYMLANETTYPMESLKKIGLEDFTRYFGEVEFKCTNVKYHKTTRKIAEMTFRATQN